MAAGGQQVAFSLILEEKLFLWIKFTSQSEAQFEFVSRSRQVKAAVYPLEPLILPHAESIGSQVAVSEILSVSDILMNMSN